MIYHWIFDRYCQLCCVCIELCWLNTRYIRELVVEFENSLEKYCCKNSMHIMIIMGVDIPIYVCFFCLNLLKLIVDELLCRQLLFFWVADCDCGKMSWQIFVIFDWRLDTFSITWIRHEYTLRLKQHSLEQKKKMQQSHVKNLCTRSKHQEK